MVIRNILLQNFIFNNKTHSNISFVVRKYLLLCSFKKEKKMSFDKILLRLARFKGKCLILDEKLNK